MSTSINRTTLLSYSAQKMFDIVNDVTSYPDYMNNCIGSKIIEQGESFMVARLDLKKAFCSTALQLIIFYSSQSE